MHPTVVTYLAEHFKDEATAMKEKHNFVFRAMAYRKLSRGEIAFAFRTWRSSQKRKRLPKNTIITHNTIVGFDEQS